MTLHPATPLVTVSCAPADGFPALPSAVIGHVARARNDFARTAKGLPDLRFDWTAT